MDFSMKTVFSCLLMRFIRSSHRRCSIEKGLLKKIRKIHRKAPVSESLFQKSCRLQADNFIKKEI